MSNELSQVSTGSMVLSSDSMNAAVAFANMMANGVATVPKHLQGNSSDCLAVTMQAMQWNMNPHAVAQKTHLINGSLGYEAQLVNAVISSSTAIEGRFHYEYSDPKTWKKANDPDAWVKVGAILKGEEEIQWGEPLYPATVTTKNSPLWKTNPKQQASYLALKYWSRLYTPAVILGVYTSDELQDMPREEREINPSKPESALRRPDSDQDDVIESTAEQQADELTPLADICLDMINCDTIEKLEELGLSVGNRPKSKELEELQATYKKRRAEILKAKDEEQK